MKKNIVKQRFTIPLALALALALPTAFPAGSSHAAKDAGQSSAATKDTRALVLDYQVYAGGMNALQASLHLGGEEKKGHYAVALTAETKGFIHSLFPWKGQYNTEGLKDGTGFTPVSHKAQSQWKKDSKRTEITYAPDGLVKTTVQENSQLTPTPRDIQQGIAKDTVDLLTGALEMLQQAGSAGGCDSAVSVFDGKRRFTLKFTQTGTDHIEKNRYSSFEGKALRCVVEVIPEAGFKARDKKRGWLAVQEHSRERKKLPTLWVAQIDPARPAVPVRMEISSDYGSVVAHLTTKIDTELAALDR